MITQQQKNRIAQMYTLARSVTYDVFVRFLHKNYLIFDELDGEWIDFSFGEGITSCISFDADGTPYLSDYVQYWDEDEEEDFDFSPTTQIYFRNRTQP